MLFAKFLDIETEGAFEFVMDPLWPMVEPALRAMNGTTKTLVCIEGIPPMHMNIGGGSAHGYVVSLSYDCDKHYVLQNLAATNDIVELTVGGAKSQYPLSMLVPLEMVLVAAKTFIETGVANPALPWSGTEDVRQPNAEALQHPAAS